MSEDDLDDFIDSVCEKVYQERKNNRSGAKTKIPEYPLSAIPFQAIVDRVADGTYDAKPTRVFSFEEIQAAHRLMDIKSGEWKNRRNRRLRFY